jgi:uncharacterized membrane protein
MVRSRELLGLLFLLVACDVARPSTAPTAALAVDRPAPAPTKRSVVLAGAVCPGDNVLTYRSFGAGFLRTWCTGCHSSTLAADDRQGAPTGVDFDRHDLFRPHAREVYARAVVEAHRSTVDPAAAAPMPPAGVVPEADRERLARWIACDSP